MNIVNQLNFVLEMHCVFFVAGAEFLNSWHTWTWCLTPSQALEMIVIMDVLYLDNVQLVGPFYRVYLSQVQCPYSTCGSICLMSISQLGVRLE